MKNRLSYAVSCVLLSLACTVATAEDEVDIKPVEGDPVPAEPSPLLITPALPEVNACLDPAVEAGLRAVELNALGPVHAEEHAESRADYCVAQLQQLASRKGFKHIVASVFNPVQQFLDRLLGPDPYTTASHDPLTQLINVVIGTAQAVQNGSNPQIIGEWGDPLPMQGAQNPPVPVLGVGISAVLLHTGKVLFWSTKQSDNTSRVYLWTPPDINDPEDTGIATQVVSPAEPCTPDPNDPLKICETNNIWCGGQTLLADGRVVVVGGNLFYRNDRDNPTNDPNVDDDGRFLGLDKIFTFNPFKATNQWTFHGHMEQGRWYPTTTKLGDGRVVITSGLNDDVQSTTGTNRDIEVFTPTTNLNGVGTIDLLIGKERTITGTYPHQFVMPDGKMFLAGANFNDNATLTPGPSNNPSAWVWNESGNLDRPASPGIDRFGFGSGVLLPLEPDAMTSTGASKIMLFGGRSDPDNPPTVTASTEVFTTGASSATASGSWAGRANMLIGSAPDAIEMGRRNNNAVLLPDGNVLTVGGQSGFDNHFNQQREALLYRPANNTWQAMATQAEARDYHSTALLLPDGRVVSAGDDRHTGNPALSPGDGDTDNIELYSPPYLFKDNGSEVELTDRPVISTSPTSVTWTQGFKVGTADPTKVDKVVLIAPSAVTHANDMHQRLVELEITSLVTLPGATGVNVKAPASQHIAPPGYYMMFLVNKPDVPNGQSRRVPSVAKWVRLGPNSVQFNAAAYSSRENNGPVTVTVTRTGKRNNTITVDYATANATAQAGSDYTTTSGTLVFPANDFTSKTFMVPVTNDSIPEPNETVRLTLSNITVSPAPAAGEEPIIGAPNPVFLSIINDD